MQLAPPTSGRIQIDRILQSETFRHADQLRHLLDYLAERSLAGDTLKEYTVGIEALGKSPEYDPRKDAAVRIQAGRLRTKRDEYYRSEGSGDSTFVNMPKGAFRIEFSARAPQAVRDPRRTWIGIAFAMAAVLALAAALVREKSPAIDPELALLWQPFLGERPPLLSIGPHLFWQSGDLVYRDWTVNRPEKAGQSKSLESVRKLGGLNARISSSYVGSGEAEGALAITRFLVGAGRAIDFRRSPLLSWDDFKTRNVILVGSPKTIAHLADFDRLEDRLAYVVTEDRIVNRAPTPGEPSVWIPRRENGELVETAVAVTRLAGVGGQGALFLIGSADGEGALAGCQALTSAAIAREIMIRVGDARDFQFVLRASVKNQTPLKIALVAHRRL